jgi:hypothetical protein
MWLPLLQRIVALAPTFFDNYTFIILSYRGLFEPDDSNFHKDFRITVDNCASDMRSVMAHAKVCINTNSFLRFF